MIGHRVLAQRYEVTDLVKEIGHLQVYRGVDRRLARPVTIELFDRSGGVEAGQVATFLHHARRLAARPNARLIGVHDAGEDGDIVYAVLEPVHGTTLAELIERSAPLPVAEAVDRSIALTASVEAALTLQLLDALPDPASAYVRESSRIKLGGLLFAGPDRPPLPADPVAREALLVQWLGLLLADMLTSAAARTHDPVAGLPPSVPAGLRRLIEHATQTAPGTPLALSDWSRGLERYLSAGQHVTMSMPARVSAQPRTAVLSRASPAAPARHGTVVQPRRPVEASGAGISCLPLLLALLALIIAGSGAVAFAFWLGSGGTGPRFPGAVAVVADPSPSPSRSSPSPARATETAVAFALSGLATATAEALATPTTAHVAPTATPSPTLTATPTMTPTDTATPTVTPTPTATPDPTALPTATPTAVPVVRVPEVVGQPFARAATVLADLGLNLQNEAEQETSAVPPGQIIAQTPGAGAIVTTGYTVKVIVAVAPPPPTLPDLRGQPIDLAQNNLSVLGLTAKITQVPNSIYPEGQVISQSPPPGSVVPRGSQVLLNVSAGDKVAVPNVVGMTESDAQSAIKAAGLSTAPGNHSGSSPAVPIGRVESETPPAGSLEPRNSTVYINVRVR